MADDKPQADIGKILDAATSVKVAPAATTDATVFDLQSSMGIAKLVPVAPADPKIAPETAYGPVGRIAAFSVASVVPTGRIARHVIRQPGMRVPKPHVEINSPRLTSQIRSLEKVKDLG